MNISEFILRRKLEQEWVYLNGFDNDDVNTNGELTSLAYFSNYFSTFIDIGANRGIFGEKVRELNPNIRTIMFEPHPTLASELSENFPNAIVHQKALSNEERRGVLNIHPDDQGIGSLYIRKYMMPNYTNKMQKIPIELVCLDSYKEDILKKNKAGKGIYIKIDAEGAEFPILQGSEKLISKEIIFFIHFEYSFAWKESNHTLMEAIHFLNKNNFQVYRLTPLGLEKIKFYSTHLDNDRYCNYVAVKNFDLSKKGLKKHLITSRDGDTDFYEF